ncbi:P-loop containing region of AAA domain-containing protein [Rhodoferax sp. OV413]|uniref:SbcC/MukB-like Walker B domain-containing protein n=1 Tax=Rhodoferax sp. OV413 TaxID=1855285 RepID=UPI00087F6ABC|nr:SbcC/MukB-like Walker B domain-containing protein [Rhodoferax sp. OV413]SDP93037.1 P-loop containing region of AAA domain-containing protein [Rhodoferax sp. OV413]
MKLDSLILVNWGQMHSGTFPMGEMTLFTGATGAGKSTMLDALQTVMTGANKDILSLNPGQDEVAQGQRSKKVVRGIEAYAVGAEFSNFSRKDGAQAYMAAVFRPSAGEEHLKPFTALVGVSARVEGAGDSRQAKLESLALVIIDDAVLTHDDFIKDPKTEECVAVERIAKHLQTKHPRLIDFNNKKTDYLCALFGRFRGKSSVTKEEATNAAKAWVKSIASRKIGDVHELVRDEILEFDAKQLQQDIDSISGLMRQVSNLRQESIRLQSNVTRLTELQNAILEACEAHEAHITQGFFVANLQLRSDDAAIAAHQLQIANADQETDENGGKILAWKLRVKALDEQRIALSARLQGIPVHNQKQELDATLAKAIAEANAILKTLSDSLTAAAQLEGAAKALISRQVPEGCDDLSNSIQRVAEAYAKTDFTRLATCHERIQEVSALEELNVGRLYELVQAFSGVNQGIDAIYDSLVGPNQSVSLSLASQFTVSATLKNRADELVGELGRKRGRLSQGQVTYPRITQAALRLLKEQFPAANVQVLCDLIEPKSEKSDSWQQAIEGYMGGTRFNLVVGVDFERDCVDYLKSRDVHATVVQGALCLKKESRLTIEADSIVQELRTANPIAQAYLASQYGGVKKVADIETLRSTPRGVTKDGVASGGHSMFLCEKVEPVFGQRARVQALERAERDLKVAEAEAHRLENIQKKLAEIKASLQWLKQPHFDASSLREQANLIEKTRETLSSLDITEVKELQDKLAGKVEEILNLQDFITIAEKRIGALDEVVQNANKAIRDVTANKQEHLREFENQIQRMKRLIEDNSSLEYAVLKAAVERKLQQDTEPLANARRTLGELAMKPSGLLATAREALFDYNSQAKSDERFVQAFTQHSDAQSFETSYASLVKLSQAVVTTLQGLQGVGLYNNRLELDNAVKSFHDVFTKQFCVEIKTRVDEGIRTLRQLNVELKNLKFGISSYSLDWSQWEPEFAEYLDFFEAVTLLADSAEPMDLFGETKLSDKHVKIRDRLVQLLLDDNHERATKDLLRIADYRNYRRYDIINETTSGGRMKLSEWATGSGGQLETPAYIVRAAVLTNRLKLFEKGPSLRLLVNDESFARMDDAHARAVLEFMRDKLDLQVLSAMPTQKSNALRNEFNREYSFTRLTPVANGELDFITDCDERILKPDKMRELWERQRQIAREKAKQLFDSANPVEETAEIKVAGE